MGSRGRLAGIGLLVAGIAFAVLIDRGTKAWAWDRALNRPLTWGRGVVRVFATQNEGLWTGWLDGSRAARPLSVVLAAIVVGGAVALHRYRDSVRAREQHMSALGVGLVVGGVWSNLADRFIARCERPTPLANASFGQWKAQANTVSDALTTGQRSIELCSTGVVDFISLHGPGGLRTPVFNLADLLLVVGLWLLAMPAARLLRPLRGTRVAELQP